MVKKIFITGCSTGIGFALAVGLKARGHEVLASCRSEHDVERLKAMGITTVQLDVTNAQSIQKAFTFLNQHFAGALDVLINNAGYGQAGALEDINLATIRIQFETNVFGLLEVSRHAIAIMRQQKSGRIINLSSILGVVSMPFRGAYNASKYAVEGLTDTMRLELEDTGIQVIAIEPGPVDSMFRDTVVDKSLKAIDIENSPFKHQYRRMLDTFKQSKRSSSLTKPPTAVLDKVVRAIESAYPKPKYVVTLPAHFLVLAKRLLPSRLLHKLMRLISKSELS